MLKTEENKISVLELILIHLICQYYVSQEILVSISLSFLSYFSFVLLFCYSTFILMFMILVPIVGTISKMHTWTSSYIFVYQFISSPSIFQYLYQKITMLYYPKITGLCSIIRIRDNTSEQYHIGKGCHKAYLK